MNTNANNGPNTNDCTNTATMNDSHATSESCISPGTKVNFDALCQPGCYVNDATGTMLRIYSTWNASAWNASCEMVGNVPFWFTYLNEDPTCDIATARNKCNSYGIPCNF